MIEDIWLPDLKLISPLIMGVTVAHLLKAEMV